MRFTVPVELDRICVKDFLRKHCSVSARTLTKLKRTEMGITRNGEHIRSIDILRAGDIIDLNFPKDHMYIEPVDLPVEVVYEDDQIIIFNKPPHMPVHPVKDHKLDTLANAAAFHALNKGENYIFRVINRLDKDTSGLVLSAKNAYAAAFLKNHTEKLYFALCEGRIEGSGTIDEPLRLKEGHGIQREIGEGGVRAVTHYKAVKNYNDEYTLLEIRLETGRTHQIRAHFSCKGHPLAGDDMYGGSTEKFPRQCLHCGEIRFIHPESGKELTVRNDINFFKEVKCI